MKKNVLVFPCGSEVGLEIYRSLCFSTHFNLIGGSSVDDHGKFVYKKYIGNVPLVEDPDFINKIKRIVNDYEVDCIIPAHDSVLLKLIEEKTKGNINCEILASPLETCKIGRSKKESYEYYRGTIAVPKIYARSEIETSSFPLFLKPDVGQGSKGTYLAESYEDIDFYLKKDSSLLILEYLPGEEFTVDCFTNSRGELLFCEGRQRGRISNGISVSSTTVNDERFLKIAKAINKKLIFKGVWFFQVKESASNELVLLEISSRIAGTMGLVRCKGVNLVLLSLFDLFGYEVDVFENDYAITIDRALENKYRHNIHYAHVYLDFDDLVIFDNEVNVQLMSFVFQCINKGIRLHLLTKHTDDINTTLKKYRLSGVFDEIIHIRKEDNKAEYISEKNAIFIDDSYSERRLVHEALGIPVFDFNMVESLME